MPHSHRLSNHFTARPRFSNKLPRLYLDSLHDPDNPYHLEIYFINNTNHTIECLELPCPLLFTDLDTRSANSAPHQYLSVQPNEAVKIADFDEIFDSDLLHRLTIIWKEPDTPPKHVNIVSNGIRKFKYKVLEWLPDGK